MNPQTDSIFQVLAHEHRDLEAQFATLQELATRDFPATQEYYTQTAATIVAHLHAEAAVLFPRLSRIPALATLLEDTRGDHARIEADALALASSQLTPSEWLRGVRRLAEDVEHLIEREETHVFPIARRAVSLDESHELASELRTVEEHERAESRS